MSVLRTPAGQVDRSAFVCADIGQLQNAVVLAADLQIPTIIAPHGHERLLEQFAASVGSSRENHAICSSPHRPFAVSDVSYSGKIDGIEDQLSETSSSTSPRSWTCATSS